MRYATVAVFSTFAFATLTACAPTTPVFDRQFGEATRSLTAQQIIDTNAPVANRNRVPEGMDGRAALSTHERYQKSFTDPPPPVNVFTIGIGGGSTGN